jgi:hypothetical protein
MCGNIIPIVTDQPGSIKLQNGAVAGQPHQN